MSEAQCRTCEHGDLRKIPDVEYVSGYDEYIICYRFPPTWRARDSRFSEPPRTLPDDFCGEWRAKKGDE